MPKYPTPWPVKKWIAPNTHSFMAWIDGVFLPPPAPFTVRVSHKRNRSVRLIVE